ncbi:MAG: S41 family peptidase [Alphaproteobacteria bacterium]
MSAAEPPPLTPREAERVFRRGYDAIAARYIEPVRMSVVTLEGLKGLSALDPGTSFTIEGRKLLVRAADEVVGAFDIPEDDDVAGWARLTVEASMAERQSLPPRSPADAEKVYKAVFEAELAHLDSFSRYAGAEAARDNRALRNGYGGIGVRHKPVDTGIEIVAVVAGSPAAGAHIEVGDVITHIDGQPCAGLPVRDIVHRLRGDLDSEVVVTVVHKGSPTPVKIALSRMLIVPETVTMTIAGDIAVMRISSFNQRTAVAAATELRRAARRKDLKGMVLDLRGNPGGLLDQAVAVSDLFLARGGIVSTRGRHPEAIQSYSANEGDIGESIPLVVLVDGRSASSAEIVAASLQDNRRAVVVGTTSYGKGTVQTVIHLPNDGELTLTWSRFYSPAGYALHGLGVLPSVCIVDQKADAAAVAEAVRAGAGPDPAVVARWRTTPVQDKEARERLREACPPARHDDAAIDLEVARRLLDDRALHTRALAALPQTAARASEFVSVVGHR